MSAKTTHIAAVIHGRFGRAARIVPIWETSPRRWMRKITEFFRGFSQPFIAM